MHPDPGWLIREAGSSLRDTGDRRKQTKLRAGGALWDGTVSAVTVLKRSGLMVDPLKVRGAEEPKPRWRTALLRDERSDRALLTGTDSRGVHPLTAGTGESDSETDRNTTSSVNTRIACLLMKEWG